VPIPGPGSYNTSLKESINLDKGRSWTVQCRRDVGEETGENYQGPAVPDGPGLRCIYIFLGSIRSN
jgi:hypothetical protein